MSQRIKLLPVTSVPILKAMSLSKPLLAFGLMTLMVSCGSSNLPSVNPIGLWDATISYQRENGEQITGQRHFLVTDVQPTGAFVSDGFYRTGGGIIVGAYISGNTVSGDVNLHKSLVYESDKANDDIICRGTFTTTSYKGTCTIGSGIDFGWQNFTLTMTKRGQ